MPVGAASEKQKIAAVGEASFTQEEDRSLSKAAHVDAAVLLLKDRRKDVFDFHPQLVHSMCAACTLGST